MGRWNGKGVGEGRIGGREVEGDGKEEREGDGEEGQGGGERGREGRRGGTGRGRERGKVQTSSEGRVFQTEE